MPVNPLPQRFVPVGQTTTARGIRILVVERPKGLHVSSACSGCIFASASCPHLQCSAWDRRDGKNVWFIKADD